MVKKCFHFSGRFRPSGAHLIFCENIIFYSWTGPGSLLWGPTLGSTAQLQKISITQGWKGKIWLGFLQIQFRTFRGMTFFHLKKEHCWSLSGCNWRTASRNQHQPSGWCAELGEGHSGTHLHLPQHLYQAVMEREEASTWRLLIGGSGVWRQSARLNTWLGKGWCSSSNRWGQCWHHARSCHLRGCPGRSGWSSAGMLRELESAWP